MKKQCADCQQEKTSKEFNRDKSSKDGFSYYCRKCQGVRRAKTLKKKKSPYQMRVVAEIDSSWMCGSDEAQVWL